MDFLGLEQWQSHLIVGLALLLYIAFSGLVLIRTGKSPLWCLLLLIPIVQMVAIWAFAFIKWPTIDKQAK